MKKSDFYTVSNLLSFLRIFLAIPIYLYIANANTEILVLIICIAIVTDILDGYFARKFNQTTELGKILDPTADKVCTTTAFIALTIYQDFPLWLTSLIIIRDAFIVLGSLFILKRDKLVTPSNIPGKVTVFFISVLALVYILHITVLFWPVTILVILSIFVSAYNYLLILLKNLKTNTNE